MPKGLILIVDDEAEIREGLELLLTTEGYETSSAETGEAGLALLEEKPFDLILLDVSLPDRNGLDLLREIRSRDSNLAVVLITAYGSIDMARAAFKSGAQDYITKPWSNDELLIQVAQAVGVPAPARRKRPAQARPEAALQFSKYYRQERQDARRSRPRGTGRAIALDGSDPRRERHGQGAHCQGAAFRLAPRRPAVHSHQYRLNSRGPSRIATLRACQRGIHERRSVEEGPV